MPAVVTPGTRVVVRRSAGLWAYERALARAGLTPVAGVDEAGRGACAGPLVVAAAVLPEGRRGEVPHLADSKLLNPVVRERVYDEIVRRAVSWSVVVIPSATVDARGLHVMNLEGMRRALARLSVRPAYVLTDGFPVPGLTAPSLAMWKGDRVTASIAAASVLAKVTRDRLMVQLHDRFPHYDFATHKGYITAAHTRALQQHGPCAEHRFSYVNVASHVAGSPGGGPAPLSHDSARIPRRTVRRLLPAGVELVAPPPMPVPAAEPERVEA
jgi:ribonuclease HII